MSTLAYAALTTRRDLAEPGTSRKDAPPGIGPWVDALAALVPAEILLAHAVIVSVATAPGDAQGSRDAINGTLFVAFIALCAVSAAFYAVPRLLKGMWDWLDCGRVFIPPLAFVGWTMLQHPAAFDAVWPQLLPVQRTVAAVLLALVLGLAAGALGYKADQRPAKKKKH